MNSRFPTLPVSLISFGLILVLFAIWYISGQSERYRSTITPLTSFTLPTEVEPNYKDQTQWAYFPDQAPLGAWETPWGVDVFFISGTTSDANDSWNIPISDVDSRLNLESNMLPNYAAPFVAAAPVYAPLYRQATLHAIYSRTENASKAIALAYSDVEKAFQIYMQDDNKGRAIILVGVGQGGLHAQRLLQQHFQTETMKQRFVAAYIIEFPVTLQFATEGESGFAPCDTDEQIHCIASWNTIRENDSARTHNIMTRSLSWDADGNIVNNGSKKLVCFNPSINGTIPDLVPPKLHRGAANATNIPSGQTPIIVENAISSQCVDGFLVVSKAERKDLNTLNTESARLFPPSYNLFYSDVLFDAAKRARIASAWLDKNAPKPAPPLPPMTSIAIAPINTIERIIDTN